MNSKQMDILRLLDDLNQFIETTPQFGPITWKLDREEVSMQIAKIRASLPQELKAAVGTVREKEQILTSAQQDASLTVEKAQADSGRIQGEAQKEAARIIELAKLEQERMVSESEILKLSKAQSEEIRNAAEREALQMRRGAEKYAHDMLSQLEGVVGKLMTTIERGKSEVAPKQDTPVVSAGGARERTRV